MTNHRKVRPQVECLEQRYVPATLTVTNLLDDGSAGSLRQRIAQAGSAAFPGLDTIVFKPGLEGTIKLNTGSIPVASSLNLVGPGAARVAVDGHDASRIFQVDGAGILNVKIQGLELLNGNAGAGDGGAILSTDENLTLVKLVISSSQAGRGGAISAEGNLTVRQCTLAGNRATNGTGGAIHFAGTGALLVDRSTISGNTSDASGGGLYAAAAAGTIRSSVISGNTTGGGGGGLAMMCETVTLLNSTLNANEAGSGGGGFLSASTTSITGSTITANSASSNGGGLYLSGGPEATATVTRCTITSNSADASGGGLVAHISTTVNRSNVNGNRATLAGGGIGTLAALTVLNSTVSGNGAGEFGGGILFLNSPASTISGSTVSGNKASRGGGLYLLQTGGAITVRNSTISGNQTTGAGGGVYSKQSLLTLQHTTLAFNRGSSGGGIFADLGTVNIESTIVALNRGANPDLDSATATFNVSDSLIGNRDGVPNPNFNTSGNNIIGTTGNEKDPLLAPLAFNGGPTMTHALKKGSPAINTGPLAAIALPFDQRGAPFKRKVGPRVDIGAYERQ